MATMVDSLTPAQSQAFAQGDEAAFEHVVRTRFDGLVEKARVGLAEDAAGAPRVAIGALMSAWKDRAQITTPTGVDDYLDEAVQHLAAEERRRRASLHRFESHEGVRPKVDHSHITMSADEAWGEISSRLHVSQEDIDAHRREALLAARRHTREHVDKVANRGVPWVPIIVGAVIMAGIYGGIRYMDKSSAESSIVRALDADEARQLSSRPGQRGSVTLAEESVVQLGAASVLRIPERFGTTLRAVKLDGAGSFTVTPDPKLPFQVRAKGASIVATGTHFVVRAYDDEPGIMVQVKEGSVRVHPVAGAAPSENLSAGDVLALADDGSVRQLTQAEVERYFGWTDGVLRLTDLPLAEAVVKLRRWYDLDVELADESLGTRPVTAVLSLESSGEALDAVSKAANVRVDYDDKQMVLRDAAGDSAAVMATRRR